MRVSVPSDQCAGPGAEMRRSGQAFSGSAPGTMLTGPGGELGCVRPCGALKPCPPGAGLDVGVGGWGEKTLCLYGLILLFHSIASPPRMESFAFLGPSVYSALVRPPAPPGPPVASCVPWQTCPRQQRSPACRVPRAPGPPSVPLLSGPKSTGLGSRLA